ncbi:MAG: hypothetical protein ACK2U1_19190 [Anaerolineales bacterium]
MKRKIILIIGMILVIFLSWRLILWVERGGWPSSGPVGDKLPPHIPYVIPADGERTGESFGFCAHFTYEAGNGMDEDTRQSVRYFFDGIEVTSKMVDIVTLEYGYPDSVGQPCYTRSDPLNSRWHTAKLIYVDNIGDEFEYTWRFEVVDED